VGLVGARRSSVTVPMRPKKAARSSVLGVLVVLFILKYCFHYKRARGLSMLGDGSVAKLAAPSGCLVGFSLLPSSEKSRSLNRLEKSGYSFSAYVVGMIYLVISLSMRSRWLVQSQR
jgi:hypothetical protein